MPELTDYWVQKLLAAASERYPEETAEFLFRRVAIASEQQSYSFRPANFGPYINEHLRFMESGRGGRSPGENMELAV